MIIFNTKFIIFNTKFIVARTVDGRAGRAPARRRDGHTVGLVPAIRLADRPAALAAPNWAEILPWAALTNALVRSLAVATVAGLRHADGVHARAHAATGRVVPNALDVRRALIHTSITARNRTAVRRTRGALRQPSFLA